MYTKPSGLHSARCGYASGTRHRIVTPLPSFGHAPPVASVSREDAGAGCLIPGGGTCPGDHQVTRGTNHGTEIAGGTAPNRTLHAPQRTSPLHHRRYAGTAPGSPAELAGTAAFAWIAIPTESAVSAASQALGNRPAVTRRPCPHPASLPHHAARRRVETICPMVCHAPRHYDAP